LQGWADWLLEVQFPELHVRCVSALENELVVVADVHGGSSEDNLAASIAKLTNGQQQLVGQGRYNVANASSMRQSGDAKFGIVHGVHDGTIQILDADGMKGELSVAHWHVHGEKVHGAASVGNGCGSIAWGWEDLQYVDLKFVCKKD